jgi:hypothetical protein
LETSVEIGLLAGGGKGNDCSVVRDVEALVLEGLLEEAANVGFDEDDFGVPLWDDAV